MSLRLKMLMTLLVVGFLLAPSATPADAATAGRVSLSVTGSGAGAVFTVRGTIYWSWPDDFPPSPGVFVEVNFYGMDGGVARRLAAWTRPMSPRGLLLEQVGWAVSNSGRWANEDRDWVFKRRDEIRATIRIYDANRRFLFETPLSNQVSGNF